MISSLANRSAKLCFQAAVIFLLTAKPGSHIALYDFMNGAAFDERSCARRCLVERPSHACVPTSSKKSGRSSRFSAAR
jgi:hypothetical protein